MTYDMIDRFLRNNLGDDDYAEYSAALDLLCTLPQRTWVGLTDEAGAVINAARAAMDASTEAHDGEGGIKIASALAASLSLCLDEYDRAIRARGQDPMPLFDDWPGGFKHD